MGLKRFLITLMPNIHARHVIKKREHHNKDIVDFVKTNYKNRFGVELNISAPITFYEKINYIKLFYDNPLMEKYVDKIQVKQLLEEAGYVDKCAKLLAIFKNVNELENYIKDNNQKSFVVKLNHTSGDVYFFNDGKWRDKHGEKIDKRVVYANLKYGLKSNYYYCSFEKPYKNIDPRILCEEYLPSMNNKGLDEYKFFCNYGNIKMINVVYGRQSNSKIAECFTDSNLISLGATQDLKILSDDDVVAPKCFDDMKKFASKMSEQFPILRVDLMTDGVKFYFCEFTFFDCGGNNIFYPPDSNKKIGDLFDISNITKKLSF